MKHTSTVLYSSKNPARMLAVLENICDALRMQIGEGKPNDELHAVMHTDAQQGIWQGEPDTFGTFDTFMHFSAGPNAVATTKPVPLAWRFDL